MLWQWIQEYTDFCGGAEFGTLEELRLYKEARKGCSDAREAYRNMTKALAQYPVDCETYGWTASTEGKRAYVRTFLQRNLWTRECKADSKRRTEKDLAGCGVA